MNNKIFFVVKKNQNGIYEYVLDSQLRPTMYRSFEQLKKYAYKFKNGDYRIAEYTLSSTFMSFEDIERLER